MMEQKTLDEIKATCSAWLGMNPDIRRNDIQFIEHYFKEALRMIDYITTLQEKYEALQYWLGKWGLCNDEFIRLGKAKVEGRLIELPFKAGDTLLYHKWDGVLQKYKVISGKVKSVAVSKKSMQVKIFGDDGHNHDKSIKNFYITKEEAEKALERGEG